MVLSTAVPVPYIQMGGQIVREDVLLSGWEGAAIRHWAFCLLPQGRLDDLSADDTCTTHSLAFIQEYTYAASWKDRMREDQT